MLSMPSVLSAFAARGQQPAMPVIGFLHPASPDANADRLRAFRLGLRDAGLVEGHNVAIEYRWAENQRERLPALAAELVRRQVASLGLTSATLSNSCTKIRKRIGQQTGRTGHIRVGGGSSPLRSTTPISANRRFP
jgi:hypothetical protein